MISAFPPNFAGENLFLPFFSLSIYECAESKGFPHRLGETKTKANSRDKLIAIIFENRNLKTHEKRRFCI